MAPRKAPVRVEAVPTVKAVGEKPTRTRVDARTKAPRKERPVAAGTIKVDKMPANIQKSDLKTIFSDYGTVLSINFVQDKNGKDKTKILFAFVDFNEAESVEKSVAAGKKGLVTFDGQRLAVFDKLDRPPIRRDRRGGRGGRGGRGESRGGRGEGE